MAREERSLSWISLRSPGGHARVSLSSNNCNPRTLKTDRQLMPLLERVDSIEAQLASLRSDIGDIAHQIDVYKTKTGGALGAGVFALLLAAGAGYDLIAGNADAWSMVAITHPTFVLIAIA